MLISLVEPERRAQLAAKARSKPGRRIDDDDGMDISDDYENAGVRAAPVTLLSSQSTTTPVMIVTPGESITSDPAFMRGHGTYQLTSGNPELVATVAGKVERINKLISVRPVKTRFAGEIGDVVVGRIVELTQKRWKVDICGRQDAVLMLASVNLPGGELRRRSEEDELQMRQLLSEGDMISAEIQAFFQDGGASLHTRSVKYGKLRNGTLVTVPAWLVKRSKSHFFSLPLGVDVVLGVNGYVWVANQPKPTAATNGLSALDTSAAAEAALWENLYSNSNDEILDTTRMNIARVCNCIRALAAVQTTITEASIIAAINASYEVPVKDIVLQAKLIVAVANGN